MTRKIVFSMVRQKRQEDGPTPVFFFLYNIYLSCHSDKNSEGVNEESHKYKIGLYLINNSKFHQKQYNKITIKRRGETSSVILQQPTFCKVLKLGWWIFRTSIGTMGVFSCLKFIYGNWLIELCWYSILVIIWKEFIWTH